MAGVKRAGDAETQADGSRKKTRIDSPISGLAPPTASNTTAGSANSIADSSIDSSATPRRRPKKYLCSYTGCDKAYDRPSKLQSHLNKHSGDKPFVCSEEGCDKSFYRSEHLKAHVKNKHSEPDQVCTYVVTKGDDGEDVECGMSFTTTSRLRRHLAIHEAKEEMKCGTCGQVFRKMETLQRHIQKEHLGEEKVFRCTALVVSRLSREMNDEEYIDDVEQGEECGATFSSITKLKTHERRDHTARRYLCSLCRSGQNEASPEIGDQLAPFPDDDIGISETFHSAQAPSFQTWHELRAHVRADHPPVCSTCGKHCRTEKELKAHIDIFHGAPVTDRQVFPCTWPGCERSFTRNGNLKVHMQTAHVKARNYVCGEFDLSQSSKVQDWDGEGCGFGLATKASLENHVLTQHLGISLPPRRQALRKKTKAEEGDVEESMPMLDLNASTPTDSVASAATPGNTQYLSLLTGAGYTESRQLVCWASDEGCPRRFVREYDLAQHMEVAHGWTVDAVNDMFAMSAWNGFVGEDMEVDAGFMARDNIDGISCTSSLAEDKQSGTDWRSRHDRYGMPKALPGVAEPLFGLDEMLGEEAMALDPALADL